jgi:hypothetical protein
MTVEAVGGADKMGTKPGWSGAPLLGNALMVCALHSVSRHRRKQHELQLTSLLVLDYLTSSCTKDELVKYDRIAWSSEQTLVNSSDDFIIQAIIRYPCSMQAYVRFHFTNLPAELNVYMLLD